MQQTETYKLNLLEHSDTVSVTPLNENMEKVEEALEETAAAIPKLEIGTYTGTGTRGSDNKTTIEFGFDPTFVLVWSSTAFFGFFGRDGISRVISESSSGDPNAAWGNGTLSLWTIYTDPAFQLNASGVSYTWLAIG